MPVKLSRLMPAATKFMTQLLLQWIEKPAMVPIWYLLVHAIIVGFILYQFLSLIYKKKRTEKQIISEAMNKGYQIVMASPFEIGLLRRGKGCRTWWLKEFDGRVPSLAHPEIQRAIKSYNEVPDWIL